jgi:uncharacterized protein YndB with AHSA1/START domain
MTTIVIILLVAIAAVLVLASRKPDTFRIERAVTIKAPPDRIFALINDFRNWTSWSPWEKMDPALKRSYGGAPAGPGAVYEWEGNKKVGKGRMEIVDAVPSRAVTIKLDFLKPFEAHNIAAFTLAPQGDATLVTWAMHGPLPYIGKVMHVFMNMDRMVGKDFEAGLANLKAAAERPAVTGPAQSGPPLPA